MTIFQKIRRSFTIQLALWVGGFVVVTSCVVVGLLASFSEDGIRDESIDTTLQALENTALRIDNTLRRTELMARLEGRTLQVDRSLIEQLLEQNGSLKQLRQSLPHAQLFVTMRDSSQLDTYITGAESGYRQLVHDGREMYVFSQSVGDRQFSLAAVCPAEDIYNKYSYMYGVLLEWGIGGVLVLIFILYLVIARHLRPLHILADAAQSIAEGNLETPIPDTRYEHEFARLQSSLKKMQSAQKDYIDEMQQKQVKLNVQHAELKAAYDEAQAYEEKKERFLRDMTDRMMAPVDKVCRSTDTLCCDYSQLSKDDMTALNEDIMSGTEEITELLDQLIQEPANS